MNQSFSFVALQGLLFPLLIFFASSAKAELAVEITEPRQFGYVLGDKIERVFIVKSMKDVVNDEVREPACKGLTFTYCPTADRTNSNADESMP